jgi:hypothetical protein
MATANQSKFQGFQSPNTTPVPDELFDKLLPILSGAELKVLLYVIRRTFGFKKGSDRISKSQLEHGITKSDGSTLDGGTGLSRRAIRLAIDSLVARNILIKLHNKSPERGHEATEYALNIANTPPGVKSTQGVGYKVPKPLGREVPPQQTVVQETVKQETDVVVDVAKDLENFGIAQSAVTKLIQSYPAAYIREKLEMAKGLVAAGSCLVSQNPAGWLRKAIEENYSPPRPYERRRQRSVREKKQATLVHAKPREPQMAEEESQQAQTVATEPKQTVATLNRDNNPEKIEPEKTDQRENQATWNKALEQLQADLPPGGTDIRLNGTTLLQVTDTAARIVVPNTTALLWLERRLYREISNALKGVLGKDLDLQFVTAP